MIDWIASYPKSGNTWIRMFVHLCVHGKDNLDINQLTKTVPAFNGILSSFLRQKGINVENRGSVRNYYFGAQIEAVRRGNKFLKTHNVRGKFDTGLFPDPQFVKNVIYVIRDPRDVAISYAHHYGHSIDEGVRLLCSSTNQIADPRDPNRAELLSDWGTHVNSWCLNDAKTLIVRFEDMQRDPAATFMKIADKLGFDVDNASIMALLSEISFDKVSALERQTEFKESVPGRPFFRTGKAGEYLEFDQASFAPITNKFGRIMRKFGYKFD